jgi:hypothetical protein
MQITPRYAADDTAAINCCAVSVTIVNDQREAMKKAYRVYWRRYVD